MIHDHFLQHKVIGIITIVIVILEFFSSSRKTSIGTSSGIHVYPWRMQSESRRKLRTAPWPTGAATGQHTTESQRIRKGTDDALRTGRLSARRDASQEPSLNSWSSTSFHSTVRYYFAKIFYCVISK